MPRMHRLTHSIHTQLTHAHTFTPSDGLCTIIILFPSFSIEMHLSFDDTHFSYPFYIYVALASAGLATHTFHLLRSPSPSFATTHRMVNPSELCTFMHFEWYESCVVVVVVSSPMSHSSSGCLLHFTHFLAIYLRFFYFALVFVLVVTVAVHHHLLLFSNLTKSTFWMCRARTNKF